MALGPPSGGDDLVGMEMDFFVLLGELEGVEDESVEVERTTHPECLLRASCRAARGVPVEAAAEAVRHEWLTNLRYSYFESHRLKTDGDQAVLEFVTQISPDGFFVTGRVEVLPSRT